MRNTLRLSLLVAIGVLLALGGTARAQSIYGPGGLLLNPTADLPARGQVTPSVLVIPQDSANIGGRRSWTSYGLDYGATDRLEIGATHLKVAPGDTAFRSGSTGAYAKYRLLDGAPGGRPDLAVGYGFLSGGDVNASVGFGALRWTVGQNDQLPAHIHLGVMYAEKLNQFQRKNTMPYAGIDFGVAKGLVAFAETRAAATKPAGAGDLRPPAAFGVVWRGGPTLKLVVAYARNGWSNGYKFSVGVGYTIGTRR